MKIKTAYEATLAAFPETGARLELYKFLNNYGQGNPCSNYRCSLHGSEVISKFLSELGFAEETFDVIVSTFDPDTLQIRWNDTKPVKALSVTLSALNFGPKLYAELIIRNCTDSLDVEFSDTNSEKHVDSTVTKLALYPKTDELVRKILETDWSVTSHPKYSDEEVAIILDSLRASFYDADGKLSPDRPYVLDLPYLEFLSNSVAKATGMRLFSIKYPFTVGRILRPTEAVTVYPGVLDMPLACQFPPLAGAGGLDGYMYHSVKDMTEALSNRGDKSALFLAGNSFLIRDNINVLNLAFTPGQIWSHIRFLYSMNYGLETTVLPYSHIGVSNFANNESLDQAYSPVPGSLMEFLSDGSDVSADHDASLMAMYALMVVPIGTTMLASRGAYRDIASRSSYPYTPTKIAFSGLKYMYDVSDFKSHVSCKHSAIEWFKLTHMPGATYQGIDKYVESVPVESVEEYTDMNAEHPVPEVDTFVRSVVGALRSKIPSLNYVFRKNGKFRSARTVVTAWYTWEESVDTWDSFDPDKYITRFSEHPEDQLKRDDTSEHHVSVAMLETNVNFDCVRTLPNDRMASLKELLGWLFASHIVLKSSELNAGFNGHVVSSLATDHVISDALNRTIATWRHQVSDDFLEQCSRRPDTTGADVAFVPDRCNRLCIIFVPTSLSYARYAYRAGSDIEVLDAETMAKIANTSTDAFFYDPAKGSHNECVRYINQELKRNLDMDMTYEYPSHHIDAMSRMDVNSFGDIESYLLHPRSFYLARSSSVRRFLGIGLTPAAIRA